MRSQLSLPLHSGQLRYHDYPKLRDLHQQRMAAVFNSTDPDIPFVSSLGNRLCSYPQRRHFLSLPNPFSKALRDLQLKRLERECTGDPGNAQLHYRFLSELAVDHPQAVISRLRHPAFSKYAINVPIAVLYLQILMQTNQIAQLDLEDLCQRLMASHALPSDVVREVQAELAAHKLPKTEQVSAFYNFLTTGRTSPMSAIGFGVPGATAAMGSLATTSSYHPQMMMGNAGGSLLNGRGMDSKQPLYVQIAQPGTVRSAVLSFVARAALVLVAFSAVGALLDERGLGRGMGMNSGSKHVQEAEQDGRKIKFDDVKGVEEAKEELEEIVMYLKDPSRFTRLGGKLPRGLLLTGPPGTGKTLLAKAIAGEADVPFFFCSGSQFEEVYVGLGAKRIRELFEAAKKKAPAIIFIDEIDAVGGTRRLKDQSALKMTLNELLVQMDGFDENNGIIVIGATNFMESLDTALLRPGRFDKHVSVPLPDVGGRKDILEMYAKKTRLNQDVDLNVLARGTTGFSGADLYNLINQAALKASVDGLNAITMSVMEYAKDKIIMGAERKSAVISAETARCTAFHEAGHAVVAVMTEGASPIHKATIMPRGQALGMVTMLPDGDQTSQSLKEMLAFMDICMGGRVAEELIFGKNEVTSGAMSDIQSATRIARNMVTKYGFSDEVGIVFHSGNNGEESASAETRGKIDQEVKKLTETSYKRAKELLSKYSVEHKLLAETLLEYETLTGDEVRDIVIKRVKPKRPVINKEGGQRGDASILTSNPNGGDRQGGKSRIPGMGKDRAD